MRNIFSLLLLASILLNACKTKEDKPTVEEASKFALSLEKDAAERRMDFFEKNIFTAVLIDRMYDIKGVNEIKASKSGLQKGVESGLKKHNYEKTLFQTLGTTGSFSIVKHYEKDNKRRVIFRAYGSGGLNYFDMELTKIKNKVGIADMLVYTTGNNLSTSMAELVDKLVNADNSGKVNFETSLSSVQGHIRDGDYEKAKAAYDRLPEELKNTKLMEAVLLGIIPNLAGEDYHAEMEKIEKKYASDPNSQLMLIDVYLVKKDYDKALRSVDMIDKNINSDPFLNYYRGLIFNMKNDSPKAIEHFEKAATALPDFAENIAELFVQYATADNKEKAIQYFTAYNKLKNKDADVVQYYKEQYPYLAN